MMKVRLVWLSGLLFAAACGGSDGNSSDGGSTSGEDADGSVSNDGPTIVTGSKETCEDGILDGDELGLDCGGPTCDPCKSGESCTEDDACASGVCGLGECVADHCGDGERNEGETDVDCGGECAACVGGLACDDGDDCISGECASDSVCSSGLKSAFHLDRDSVVGRKLHARSHSESTVEISSVEYDWDEGDGFESASEHTYADAGVYTVRQRATDATGTEDIASLKIRMRESDARLDPDTATADTWVGEDDLTVAMLDAFPGLGVVGDTYVQPESGAYYFEVEILTHAGGYEVEASEEAAVGFWGFGVVTDGFEPGAEMGGDNKSVYISSRQSGVFYNREGNRNMVADFGTDPVVGDHFGVVIDYTGQNPIIHVIRPHDAPVSVTMRNVTAPLTFGAAGQFRTDIGPLMRFNNGRDTENFPFVYDPAEALADASPALPSDITMGFGGSNSFSENEPPVIEGPDSVSTGRRETVTLSVTVTDDDGVDLTHSVRWENLSESFNARQQWWGSEIEFAPPSLGTHYLRASVVDQEGQVAEKIVAVKVTGDNPVADHVRLIQEPGVTCENDEGFQVEVSEDGQTADWTSNDKCAVRSQQAVLDGFHYFEGTRAAARSGTISDHGIGLVTPFGKLAPFETSDAPFSCAAQASDGSLWKNYSFIEKWNSEADRVVGLAVDYRGDYPIVYYIARETLDEDATRNPRPTVIGELHLQYIHVPVHAMFYGRGPSQWQANFGNEDSEAFKYDAEALLEDYGVDASALKLGFGR